MAIQKFTPQNSDLFLGKDQGDHMLGKFGHLNYLLKLINAASLTFSPGSIIFSDGTGNPAADPAQLHWDDTNNRLGIGNATPTEALDVTGSIKYSGTLYTPFTTGSIPFTGASGALSQNNSNLFWDNTNARLGIRTTAPSYALHTKVSSGTIASFENTTNSQTFNFNNGNFTYTTSVNGFPYLGVTNLNSGVSAGAGLLFLNDIGKAFQFILGSSTNTNSGNNECWMRSANAPVVRTVCDTGYIAFNAGGKFLERMRIHASGNVTIGSTTDVSSAVLNVDSTTKGFLPPRMTGAQAEAIASPVDGLLVYVNAGDGVTINSVGFWGRSAGVWTKLN